MKNKSHESQRSAKPVSVDEMISSVKNSNKSFKGKKQKNKF
jgi:hypothetical protein